MNPTPRSTRLVRTVDLQAFRDAIVTLAREGPPLQARDRIVVVPTHAAGAQLIRSIEDQMLQAARTSVVLPELVTPGELTKRLGERLPEPPSLLSEIEREVLLGAACRAAQASGVEPPFRLRPGLVAEILRLYDELKRRQNSVDEFERRVLGLLEPGAAIDRGAERLVRQTRFLVASFREFERRLANAGEDEHTLRARLLSSRSPRPYVHAVIGVADEAFDAYGLFPADWDLLARLPGLERLDVVVTDTQLAGALHERLHRMLPGIEETRHEALEPPRRPALVRPPGAEGALIHRDRDREAEIAAFARRVKADARRRAFRSLGRVALVVRQRLPYVYLARDILRSAGLPCQLFDALPLAAEPAAATLDLIFTLVAADFARAPAVALLRSPHLHAVPARDVDALDRALAEAGYVGDLAALDRLIESWRSLGSARPATMGAIRAGERLLAMSRALSGLGGRAPVAEHVQTLLDFLKANERIDVPEGVRARHLRAREAIRVTLRSLADAYGRFDAAEVDGREVAGLARRWIESQTFAPRTGDAGVHVIDADSARFGDFEYAHVAGLVEGEWPDRARRNIFYSHAVLRELGWSSESDRLAGVRSAFADLLRLPSRRLSVSAFTLEADALVSVSPLADEVARAGLSVVEDDLPAHRIFSEELLSEEPVELGSLGPLEKQWASRRVRFHQTARPPSYHGFTSPHPVRPYSLSALERYQDCPFKFFASDVLRLEEAPEDQSALTPRARGRFVHEVLQRFFEAWDAGGRGAITPARVDEARALMAEVAEPLLAALSEADAALERARLFGSAIAAGWIDLVLADEASSGGPVEERWLEHRFDGEFALGRGGSRRVALKGVADRVDLLPGRRLRVIDYKSGRPPDPARALQAPAYALCVQEQLEADRGEHWEIEEASYLAFAGRRSRVGVPAAGDSNAADVLRDAARRLTEIVDGIGRGEFPPRPHDTAICEYCAYVTVCRKDYVHV